MMSRLGKKLMSLTAFEVTTSIGTEALAKSAMSHLEVVDADGVDGMTTITGPVCPRLKRPMAPRKAGAQSTVVSANFKMAKS